MMKDVVDPSLKKKNIQRLFSNLMCTANKTYSSCVPRCISWVQTASWMVGNKKTHLSYVLHALPNNTNHIAPHFAHPAKKKIQLFIWFVQSNITCVGSTSACDRQHRLSVVIVIHLGPITAECFVTYSGKTPPEVHGSSSRRGHRRNPFFPTTPDTVRCRWVASVCSLLRQKTQTHHGDRGSTALGAADAGLWTDCTTAKMANPQIQLSCHPISCDAPKWVSRF